MHENMDIMPNGLVIFGSYYKHISSLRGRNINAQCDDFPHNESDRCQISELEVALGAPDRENIPRPRTTLACVNLI